MIRTKIEKTEKVRRINGVLFAAPLLAGLMVSSQGFAKPANYKGEVVGVTVEGRALKAFDKATQGLGKLSEGSIKNLTKIGQMIIAVVSGKGVVLEEEACIGCLREKGEVDPLTGEISRQKEEVVLDEYQFSIGNKSLAMKFAKVLRDELKGLKGIVVTSDEGRVIVRNTNNQQTVAFD